MIFRKVSMPLLAIAGAFAVGSAGALAQDTQQPSGTALTEQDARSFFEQAGQNITAAINGGDYARLISWMDDYVADSANFFLSEEIMVDDQRKSFSVTTLAKNDMIRLGQMALGVLSGMQGQPVSDYTLSIEVAEVTAVGPNALTATTRIVERGQVALQGAAGATGSAAAPETGSGAVSGSDPATGPATGSASGADEGAATGQAGAASGDGAPITVVSEARCSHLISRDPGTDQLKIGMTSCQARTQL